MIGDGRLCKQSVASQPTHAVGRRIQAQGGAKVIYRVIHPFGNGMLIGACLPESVTQVRGVAGRLVNMGSDGKRKSNLN